MSDADPALLRHLAAIGALNPDGVGRAARLSRCDDCGRRVLTGLDDERAGMAVDVDLHDLDAVGEWVAIQIGVATFNLRPGYSNKGRRIVTLDARYRWDMAAPMKYAVLAQHRCGMEIPPAAQQRPWPLVRTATTADDGPPF